jgi:hypothetical protein
VNCGCLAARACGVHGWGYRIATDRAAPAQGPAWSEAIFGELTSVVGMANETNRPGNGYRVPIDAAFER